MCEQCDCWYFIEPASAAHNEAYQVVKAKGPTRVVLDYFDIEQEAEKFAEMMHTIGLRELQGQRPFKRFAECSEL